MKLLFVITRADTLGGAQVHVRDLAKALMQANHSVLVVTGAEGLYSDVLKKNRIELLTCSSLQRNINLLKDWQALRFLIRIIRQFQPDIISTHSSKAGILGRIAAKITNTPCIFTAHGWAFTQGVPEPTRSVYQWLEKLAEPLAQRIICVSAYDRLIGLETGMDTNRILNIHNGMPDIPNQLRANPLKNNPVRIVMVARFDKQKDHVTLLKAFHKIPDAQLNLVGDGPSLEAIKALAVNLKINERVNFLGYCTNVAEILAQAQVFLLISNWEGFPRTTIEAMRAGLPVIVSNVGGAAEAVIEGVTGYSVPPANIDALHKRLQELVSNAELRKKMGEQGRKQYEAELTFTKMFERTLQVYEQVLAESQKGNNQ